MKSVSLFFYCLFLNTTFKIFSFIFIMGLGSLLALIFISSKIPIDKTIIWFRLVVYFLIIFPLSYLLFKGWWFIRKYKREALILSNNEFDTKYYNFVIKPPFSPLFLNRFNMIIREIELNPDEIQFENDKKQFLYKVHLRIFILEFVLFFILFTFFVLLTILIETIPNIIEKGWFTRFAVVTKSDKNSLKGLGLFLLFIPYFCFTLMVVIFTRNFLYKISYQLMRNSTNSVYNYFRKSMAIFFIPKPEI